MSKTKPSPLPTMKAQTDLPEGWVVVALQDLCHINPGKPPMDALPADAPVTFVPMPAVDANSGAIVRPTRKPFAEARRGSFTPFAEGDVLIAKITPCMENGKAALARDLLNGLGFGSTEFHVFRSLGAVLPDYIYRYVRQESFREEAKRHMSGNVGQQRVPADFIKKAEMPLPPLAEQKRIVAKVEALLERVNAARTRLAKVPAILKRFRQSVLAAACSGQLTADWREAVGHTSIGVCGPGCGHLRELPPRWLWSPLGSLGDDPRNPIQTGPFGAQLHRDEFVPEGVPVVAVGNLTGMGFTTEGLYFVTPKKAKQLSRYSVNAGDVLFARSGATLGKVCVAPAEVNDWRMTGHILRVRLNNRRLLPDMAVYALHGDPEVIDQVQAGVRGITRPGYNTSLLKAILVPVPPLSEQQEIVRRVETLFTLADKIEARVQAATARVEKITQAILAKAFRGELVPTEAELARTENRPYEPATTLLDRIRAARAAKDTSKPKKTRRRAKR